MLLDVRAAYRCSRENTKVTDPIAWLGVYDDIASIVSMAISLMLVPLVLSVALLLRYSQRISPFFVTFSVLGSAGVVIIGVCAFRTLTKVRRDIGNAHTAKDKGRVDDTSETTPSEPCPDERLKSLTSSVLRVKYAATCLNWIKRLLALRQKHQSRWRKLAWGVAGCACILVVAGLFAWSRYESRKPTSEIVDLANASTFGYQPGQLKFVVLPAARLHLTIILPSFSSPGQYVIAVVRDREGKNVVAEGTGPTNDSGDRERVTVDLDLRGAKNGPCFLLTSREQDHAVQYYFLKIE
jgi:hypothetical protein